MLHDKDLVEIKGTIFRVLSLKDGKALVIDCRKKTMPYWVENSSLAKGLIMGESLFLEKMGKLTTEKEELSPDTLKIMHERYSLIAGVLPFIEDDKARNEAISRSADLWGVSKQTIRHYLCKYLVYQDEDALAPKARKKTDLTKDQKHMRWALNKYYYTTSKNSLMTAYTMMLKERYCDGEGQLKENYPTFYQFRYFFRKTRSLRKYYISRGGIKDYQQNHRPLTGDGVQEYAPMPGTGMLDATVCDIYLVNDAGALVGRPILTACVDACTGLCCGYALGWEGGMSSVRNMLLNVVADKNDWCRKFGIEISDDDWPSKELPAVLVTDMGREYCSYLLEQITDLGVKIVNLPAYRPELKGPVEKFFDLIQGLYKPQLKGKGVIAPNYQQRGAHDYRKDACLTLKQFEAIVLRCIVYYNSQQVMNYPYSAAMLAGNVQPHASDVWRFMEARGETNLIPVEVDYLAKILLPRTAGQFTRNGLIVKGLRYHLDGCDERYLAGGTVVVAYDPDCVDEVWLLESGYYKVFRLIERCYSGLSMDDALSQKERKNTIIRVAKENGVQGRIDMISHIETVSQASIQQPLAERNRMQRNRNAEKQRTAKR